MQKNLVTINSKLLSKSLQKKILKNATYKQLTLYPILIGTALIPVGFLVDSLIFFGSAIGFGIGITNWITSCFFQYRQEQRNTPREQEEKVKISIEGEISSLVKELLHFNESYAATQVVILQKAYLRFNEVVLESSRRHHLNYEHCLSGAEAMFLQSIHNIKMIITNHKNIRSMDLGYSINILKEARMKGEIFDDSKTMAHLERAQIARNLLQSNEVLRASIDNTTNHFIQVTREISNFEGESVAQQLEQATLRFTEEMCINKKIREDVRAIMSTLL